tara:strand:+ start:427 stop:621 length:195 start_codon:yes stop_codon:yes gene_type:complete
MDNEKLFTYCMIDDTHHLVVFYPTYVRITECDDEGVNNSKDYTLNEFVDFVNENNIDFYDWEVE